MYKVDLHTHSVSSHDGGITAAQYKQAIRSKVIDVVAITDHNSISFAQALKQELGPSIIVGEEIMTSGGEIIGLFLSQRVPAGLTPRQTIKHIKDQGGFVYIPHPFETVRKGLHPVILDEIIDFVDIIEICNGRAFFQNKSQQAVVWGRVNNKLGAASSDAHGVRGLGTTYTSTPEKPTQANLLELLKSGVPITARPSVRALLYPKVNRLRKKVKKS